MTTGELEEELLRYTKGLPKETLQEIIDFVQFVRQKRLRKTADNITAELSLLNSTQITHLEEEFKDYKQRYPSE